MERKEIKKMLPIGWVGKIAEETGYSVGYVYHWIQGRKDNAIIEKAIMKYLAEVLEEKKRLIERIKEAI